MWYGRWVVAWGVGKREGKGELCSDESQLSNGYQCMMGGQFVRHGSGVQWKMLRLGAGKGVVQGVWQSILCACGFEGWMGVLCGCAGYVLVETLLHVFL